LIAILINAIIFKPFGFRPIVINTGGALVNILIQGVKIAGYC